MPVYVTQSNDMNNQVDEKLRAALQEMDDIMKVSFDGYISAEEACYTKVKVCCDDLCTFLRQCADEDKALKTVSDDTRQFLRDWLKIPAAPLCQPQSSQVNTLNKSGGEDAGYSSNHSTSSNEFKQSEEIENLKRQVSNLQSQVQDGRRKTKDMELRLTNTNDKLIKAEERLHKEQLNKTYMESHKLDLMAEVAELRMRLQSIETERTDYRERYEGLQSQVLELHEKLIMKEKEVNELKSQVARSEITQRNGTISHLNNPGIYGSLDREALRMRHRQTEVESLKKAVNDLIAAGQEKDRKINELRKAVSTYQRVEEIILQSHCRPRSSGSESCGSSNDRTVKPENGEHHGGSNGTSDRHAQRQNGFPNATSTPVADSANHHMANGNQHSNGINQYSTISGTPKTNDKSKNQVKRSNSFDAAKFNKIIVAEPERPASKTPAPTRKMIIHEERSDNNKVRTTNGTAACISSDEDEILIKDEHKKKKAGFKKFFSRLKKSSSQEALDELGATTPAVNKNFKRGGIRATAGPRLGWGASQARPTINRHEKGSELRAPFYQWDSNQVVNWLNEIGLNMYVSECRRWNKTGKQFLEASQQDIDKELRICNPLHRKKIHLALEAERSGTKKDQTLFNTRAEWVSKWLDDIGLPQYKDQFYEARVDSRMLNYIAVEDLLYMKISNALNHASIKRGIEVLRKNNFNLSSLKRRPSSGSNTDTHLATPTHDHDEVTLWTNHRVMEWLRSIDLSEYVANLRGSGVHGALIMLEPKFTVEHLATILNIPSHKTLLRRHLTAHFINLIGKEVQDKKTDAESGIKLEINTKVKSKKNPFKKNRSAVPDYLCPIDLEPIDARAEDKRIKEAVAMYKKELNRNQVPEEKS